MTVPNVTFYSRVDKALRDPQLQQSLGMVTDRFVTGRRAALETLPHAEAVRDHARRIRAHTLANLDRYLAQFAEAVAQNGGQVYWAADAAEATRYITDLAQKRNVKNVVKSKSMVSEELHLNQALEEAGLHVCETDLGEFIIQLAGETPSHIIVPVIHKNRRQVADLFRTKLNATDDDLADVPRMTALARRLMRADFIRADMGISGVNFGVAESGSICLVTNEGNGRLTTTLPPLHVAIMGMERLVPTIADLGIMLQLLARHATGQKLSVYSNIVTGPRRPTEPDGPTELHIVIIDNGRSNLLGSKQAEILYCIRCGACLNACPVYRHIGGHAYGSVYPGPIGSVVTPGLHGLGNYNNLPHASSLCGACRDVCPVRINIPRMLLNWRDQSVQQEPTPLWLRWGLRLYRFAALRPALFHRGGQIAAWGMRLLARRGWLTWLPGPLSGWTDHRHFPAMAAQSFSRRWQTERKNKVN
jgi:L-lactate dehydrogenase complex protein LldF